MAQSFFEGHDGAPVERNSNMSSRTFAVLEHRTLTVGEMKRKESATDDDFDEISTMSILSELSQTFL